MIAASWPTRNKSETQTDQTCRFRLWFKLAQDERRALLLHHDVSGNTLPNCSQKFYSLSGIGPLQAASSINIPSLLSKPGENKPAYLAPSPVNVYDPRR